MNFRNQTAVRPPRSMHMAGGLVPRPARSAGSDRLEVIVSLDDLPQLVFGGAVAAVGVGMMAFHQFLEAHLDLGSRCRLLQPKSMKRLAFGVMHRSAPLGLAGLRRARTGGT